MLSLRLGSADASNDAKNTTTHKAYDLIANGFGPGANGPILVVANTSKDGSAAGAAEARSARCARPRASHRSPTRGRTRPGTAAIATLIAKTGPAGRGDRAAGAPPARRRRPRGDGRDRRCVVNLGGQTASAIDFSDVIGDRLPIFIGAVLVLSFLLLLLVFRSVLVPLKAVLMNLLSIAAAYGVIVADVPVGLGRQHPRRQRRARSRRGCR